MKTWSSFLDVDKAVKTIQATLHETGSLPARLVIAYDESLANTTKGMVQRFYEKLTEQCPKALKYFSDKKTTPERMGENG
jgi:hypothetical protein